MTTLYDIKVELNSALDHEYSEAFQYLCDHGLSWDAKERPTYLPVTTSDWVQANAAKSEATIWLGLAIGNAQRDVFIPGQGRDEIIKALAAGGDPNDLALECWETIHRPYGLLFLAIDAGLRLNPKQAAELLAIWLGADAPGAEEALTDLLASKQSSTLLAAIHEQATKLAATPKRKI